MSCRIRSLATVLKCSRARCLKQNALKNVPMTSMKDMKNVPMVTYRMFSNSSNDRKVEEKDEKVAKIEEKQKKEEKEGKEKQDIKDVKGARDAKDLREREEEDRRLFDFFDSYQPKLQILREFMGFTPYPPQYTRLCTEGVLDTQSPFTSVRTYIELQHPLLKKYEFDPVNFLSGAKEAFEQVQMAIASVSFANYITNASKDATHADLLRHTMHPTLYEACYYAITDLKSRGINTHMTSIKVESVVLNNVYILMGEDAHDEYKAYDKSGDRETTNSMDNTNTTTTSNTENKENTMKITDMTNSTDKDSKVMDSSGNSRGEGDTGNTGNKDDIGNEGDSSLDSEVVSDYPPGSVVAVVVVMFTANESYTVSSEGGPDVPNTRTTSSKWTFKGCLSGQKELEWKIVGFI